MSQELIANITSYFSQRPVKKAWIFGSYSRNEANEDSDVDILISFDETSDIGIFEHYEIATELSKLLNKEVDLVTDGTLYPWVREKVDKEKILIYER